MSKTPHKPSITIDPIYIKNLVQLSFSTKELKQYSNQLKEILKYIEGLNQLPTDKLTPTYQTTGIANRFQKPTSQPQTLTTEEALSNAPNQKNKLFQIKGMQYEK